MEGLHSSSKSSATSDGSRSSKSSSDRCELTITSVNQTHKLLRLLRRLPPPDPHRDESVTSWCDLFSLESLRLTLPQILQDCRLTERSLFEEFPFSSQQSVLGTVSKHSKASPSRPKAHIDLNTLSVKERYLKLLIRFYENRIQWLSSDSRQWVGLILGQSVAVVAEDSNELSVLDGGCGLERYKQALRSVIEEQLQQKETVYLVKFGSRASPSQPQPLTFRTKKTQCEALAGQWVDRLEGEGSCNLLDALRAGLSLRPHVDTIVIILHTQPDQDVGVVQDFLVDSLTGESSPQLHIVGFHTSTPSLRHWLAGLAEETHARYHSVEECESVEGEMYYKIEDSDIDVIRNEISRTKITLSDVGRLKHGVLDNPIIEILRELSMSTEWAEDDDFPSMPRPSGDHALSCDSREWLKTHGTESRGLSLHKFLSPNAYPQLSEHVQIIDKMAMSHVYDVMPVFTWHDGSTVYLHVDVEGFHHYLHTLTQHITHTLTPRLHWLLSGSNVPFGVLTQQRVVVVVESTHSTLAHILTLQQHLRTLLEEQLAHVESFNIVRFGDEVTTLCEGFTQPSRETLLQAWEWILGMSPCGTCDLLSALKTIFESETLLTSQEDDSDPVGVCLVVTTLPDQSEEVLCSYLEQAMAGHALSLNVIYYNMEYTVGGLVVPGREGGRYGGEQETEECLRAIARTGRGRFHHFRVSGSSEGDDTDLLLGEISQAQNYLITAEKILNDYREFCRRNVPPPPPLVSSGSPEHRHTPPPTHPRQTAASLARLNAGLKRASSLQSLSSRVRPHGKGGGHRLLRTQSYYTGRRNQKVVSWDFMPDKSRAVKEKGKPLIPIKEAYVSSKEWLLKYSLEKLDLMFNKLLPSKSSSRTPSKGGGVTYKHINHQGEVVDLLVNHSGLKSYVSRLNAVLERYKARMDWLQRDCHSCVGVMTERDAVFLLDISISMATHLEAVKHGLCSALRDHPPSLKRFNIVTFSTGVTKWHDQLTPVSMETIAEATEWIQTLKAEGGSCLLEAIKVGVESGAEGVYLVTDGVANHTQDFLLSQLPVLRRTYGERWRVNTATVKTAQREAQLFLKQLTHSTGGRFHVAMDTTCDSCSQTGDDVHLLSREIKRAQNCLKQANTLL